MKKRLAALFTAVPVLCVCAFIFAVIFPRLTGRESSVPGLVYTYLADENPVGPLIHKANSYLEQKDPARAEQIYRDVVRQAPGEIAGYVGLGTSLFQQERYAEAEEQYLKALSLDSGSVEALMGLGSVAHARRDYDRAKEYYSKALSFAPANPNLYWGLAITYEGQGDYKQAIQAYQRVVDLAPGTNTARLAGERMQALKDK